MVQPSTLVLGEVIHSFNQLTGLQLAERKRVICAKRDALDPNFSNQQFKRVFVVNQSVDVNFLSTTQRGAFDFASGTSQDEHQNRDRCAQWLREMSHHRGQNRFLIGVTIQDPAHGQ